MEIPLQKSRSASFIDDAVMAPESSFEDEYWQEGPYYAVSGLKSHPEWYGTWSNIQMNNTANGLQALAISLEEGFGAAIHNKSRLVIYEQGKKARSRVGHLNEVSWNKEDKN